MSGPAATYQLRYTASSRTERNSDVISVAPHKNRTIDFRLWQTLKC